MEGKLMAIGQDKCFLIDENKKLWWTDVNSYTGLPTSEFTLVPDMDNLACVAVEATTHCLILTDEGEVYSHGQSFDGQLGYLNSTDESVNKPRKIFLSSRIMDVAAGRNFSLLLDENGCVWVCGNNSSGKLGCITQERNQTIPLQLENLPKISAVSAGYDHSLLLDINSNVWAFGANGYGQLGLGIAAPTTVKAPTLVVLPPIAAIAAGNLFSLFLDKEGFVWGCGSNANAGCLESDTIRMEPHKMEYLPKVVSICAASNGSFISEAGELYSTHYGDVKLHISPAQHKVCKQASKICEDIVAVASGIVSQLILDSNFAVFLRTASNMIPQKIQTPQMGRASREMKSANKLLS